MSQPRIGELLSRLVRLNGHDIDEILHEQAATHKRFGEIALSWGLCQPEHIWQAWSHQLTGQHQRISLLEFGIDAQAISHLPRDLAWKYHAIPMRFHEQRMIVAVAEAWHERAAGELPRLLGQPMSFVVADPVELEQALAEYYPPLQKTA